jgi:hypothetical protein
MIVTVSLLAMTPGIPKTMAAIRIDRLSSKQVRLWNSIREVVFAKDGAGRLLHPRLEERWQSVEASGHLIFIEMVERSKGSSSKAGEMILERIDPGGGQHIISIRLFLPAINHAFAARRRPGGAAPFQPLAGLSREARYAEVLGHELAHVERAVADPDYRRLYIELDRELNSYSARRRIRKGWYLDPEEQETLGRIEILVDEIERPVLAAEAEIWHELSIR